MLGALTLIPPPSELPPWLAEFLRWADEFKRLEVWANADTPEDARKARELGATGIGLCRTEHMFMQQRSPADRAAHDHGEHAGSARRGAREACCRSSATISRAS